MHLALVEGEWPVLDTAWVYPAGALLPMLLPAWGTTTSPVGYAVGWSVVVTALGLLAAAVVLRASGGARPAHLALRWWAAFLVLLGPVAIGRLDGVLAPLVLVALTYAARRPAIAAALLTVGAWIKVAPGALLLPLLGARRDLGDALRRVVLPAAAVSAAVVVAVAAGGGLPRLASFLGTQSGRDLQVEAVAATPWMLGAALGVGDAVVSLDEELVTYEVSGPGATLAADLLDLALPLALLGVAILVLLAWRRDRGAAVLLPASLTTVLVLVVCNKVGSPQFMTWLAPPVVVMLAAGVGLGEGRPPKSAVLRTAALTLGVVALTQVVFPWGYLSLLEGDLAVAVVLAVRNVALIALLVLSVRMTWRLTRVRAG